MKDLGRHGRAGAVARAVIAMADRAIAQFAPADRPAAGLPLPINVSHLLPTGGNQAKQAATPAWEIAGVLNEAGSRLGGAPLSDEALGAEFTRLVGLSSVVPSVGQMQGGDGIQVQLADAQGQLLKFVFDELMRRGRLDLVERALDQPGSSRGELLKTLLPAITRGSLAGASAESVRCHIRALAFDVLPGTAEFISAEFPPGFTAEDAAAKLTSPEFSEGILDAFLRQNPEAKAANLAGNER